MKNLLCGLIGAGIQRSLSPALHEEEARHHGLRLHYQLIDLDTAGAGVEALPGLITAARIMGFDGLNVTHPYKQSVIPLLDALSEEARAIGAVNTIVRVDNRFVGHNTDGSGWSWGLRRALPQADLSRVVLLGAGGAGSAIAYEALRLGVRNLLIVDPDASRASALTERMNAIHPKGRARAVGDIAAAMEGCTGLIHATPTGMDKLPGLPLPAALLRPELWVSEIVYFPLETELLKTARRIGCATADGGHMTVGQALLGFKLFTGREPDAERMDAHCRWLLS